MPSLALSLSSLLLVISISSMSQFPAGQSEAVPCVATAHAVVLYSPYSNLERSELETLRTARVSVDVAMYSFTDRELAEELARLARSGVRVRVYRNAREYAQEQGRGPSTTEMLLAAGAEVRVKSSHDLMQFKSSVVDGTLSRTGSSNWSPTGLKWQDNDVVYEADPVLAKVFLARFEGMWGKESNLVPRAAAD